MSVGRFILTVLLASMLAGCAGTVARDRTAAEPVARNGDPTVQQSRTPAAGQAQAGLDGNGASPPPRARKRPKITAKPHQAAIQGTQPPKKPDAGVSSGGSAPIAKNSMPAPAEAAQVAQTSSGDDGVTGLNNSPGQKPAATGAVADLGGVPAVAPQSAAAEASGAETVTDAGGEPEDFPRIAMLSPGSKAGDRSKATDSPKPPSFEERSLDCDVIELMGKFIGQRHIRGEPRVEATDKAIDDVLRQTGGERDERFVFSGRVYGMLIYRLERDHSAEGYGAYGRSACRILRGGKGIVPADESSEYQLNQALRTCESGSRTGDELYSCISRRMEEIVQKRGS